MKQTILIFSLLLLDASSMCAQSTTQPSDSVGTTANVPKMSWEVSDSISANGIVPSMRWDTDATSALSNVLNQNRMSGRRFDLDGKLLLCPCGRIMIFNKHKIIIKQ